MSGAQFRVGTLFRLHADKRPDEREPDERQERNRFPRPANGLV